MEFRTLGKSGVRVSEQILGCWVMGGSYWGGAEDKDSIAAIRTALDGGVTTLDTAYIYGNGRSERIVGEAVKAYDREQLTLITKLWRSEMTRDKVIPACEESLRAMQTDYADVYFIHYPSDTGVPIGETMEQMMKLKSSGKIRAVGVSNFSLEEIKEAQKYGEIDVIQPCYSLVWRQMDKEEFGYCVENGIGVITYCALAQGILTGKFTKDTTFPAGDGRGNAPLFQAPYFEGALGVAEQLRPFAAKYGKTLAQIAVNWQISKPGISAPIVGGRNAKQVEENLLASGWRLDKADFDAIDSISRAFAYTLPKFKTFFDGTIVE